MRGCSLCLDEEQAEENFDTTFSDIFRVQGNEKDVKFLKINHKT